MSKGQDAKYFSTQKKGEIHELRNDLNSANRDKVKDAVKKVIASMTIGKDVSALFTDVIKCMQTDNIEIKKLVYLYIINYARSQPDKAILVVNTFQKDSQDRNPLIRALAIRTMGCIRVERITQFLCDPLAACLKDKDPYVRKTAAVCVAKLYDLSPDLVEDQGFLDTLRDMISDSNHSVVANAVAALVEIAEASNKDVFQMNADMLSRLQTALDACTEWGQVSILDCLAKYTPSVKDAEEIVERVAPRLKHANSAVALSAVKVIMKYLDIIKDDNLKALTISKLQPPLITLLSEQKPEVQYVALRNIHLIVQKRPEILANAVKHFFCKYNDPLYVKMEKLEIMIALASMDNIEKVLLEFKDYASEVDVDFVRKSVLAIGRCAIKLPGAADKCIVILLQLIENKVNYVVQEAIIVIKDIFRKYPNKYESIITKLCDNLDTLDEPEAKSAMIWIVGEYGDRIDNAARLLSDWTDTFEDENQQVQLQLLTAVVKLFLKNPESAKTLVTRVLKLATENSDNPDLRDRGYIYWRLLSTDTNATLDVVFAPKQSIEDDTSQLDPEVLDGLVGQISTLASIYHKMPEAFVRDSKGAVQLRRAEGKDDEEDEEVAEGEDVDIEEEEESEQKAPTPASTTTAAAPAQKPQPQSAPLDLLGLGALNFGGPAPAPAPAPATSTATSSYDPLDILGLMSGSAPAPAPQQPAATASSSAGDVVLTAEKGLGLEIRARVGRQSGKPCIFFTLSNKGSVPLSSFPIRFNTNYYNLQPASQIKLSLNVGETGTAVMPLNYVKNELEATAKGKGGILQVAMKLAQVVYFNIPVPAEALFEEEGVNTVASTWISNWKTITNESSVTPYPAPVALTDDKTLQDKLKQYNVLHIATRSLPTGKHVYLSSVWHHADALIELHFTTNGLLAIKVKSTDAGVAEGASQALQKILV